MARKAVSAEKHPGKHPGSENLQPHPPFSPDNQPAPENRSGGPNPITRKLKALLAQPGQLDVFGKKVLALAKRGNKSALEEVLARVDGPRPTAVTVNTPDLSGWRTEDLQALRDLVARNTGAPKP